MPCVFWRIWGLNHKNGTNFVLRCMTCARRSRPATIGFVAGVATRVRDRTYVIFNIQCRRPCKTMNASNWTDHGRRGWPQRNTGGSNHHQRRRSDANKKKNVTRYDISENRHAPSPLSYCSSKSHHPTADEVQPKAHKKTVVFNDLPRLRRSGSCFTPPTGQIDHHHHLQIGHHQIHHLQIHHLDLDRL